MRQVYLQMLLHINENFDDDILLDNIMILNQKNI